jgi:magnesium-transporting ATPase (P-type)
LLCGRAFIEEDDWLKLSDELKQAKLIALKNERIEKENEVVKKIEREFELVGATALEDKLQVGVPQTISELKKANIKIW